MDRLSIFTAGETTQVRLTSNNNKSLDDLVEGLDKITAQLKATHLGHELYLWDEEVELIEE